MLYLKVIFYNPKQDIYIALFAQSGGTSEVVLPNKAALELINKFTGIKKQDNKGTTYIFQ